MLAYRRREVVRSEVSRRLHSAPVCPGPRTCAAHLLVERRGLETHGVDNVVDLLGTVGHGLLSLLGGGVGTNVNITVLDKDKGTVDLVGDVVDLLAAVSA